MDKKILGFDQNVVYTAIIILILVILGVITFHYYAFVSAGDKAALSGGFGAGFKFMPVYKKEHLDGQEILSETNNAIADAKARYCISNHCTKDKCPFKCTIAGCPCK